MKTSQLIEVDLLATELDRLDDAIDRVRQARIARGLEVVAALTASRRTLTRCLAVARAEAGPTQPPPPEAA
jgi:hypothetical protein